MTKSAGVRTTMSALVIFVSSICGAAEPKPTGAAKIKAEAAAKAEAVSKAKAQQAAENRADDEQEKKRWIWRAFLDINNVEAYWPHSSERPGNCKGNLRAVKSRFQMGKNEVIKELCWFKRDKDTVITIEDPDAILFGTTKIDAAKFEYIPSDKERKKAEAQRMMEEYARRQEQFFKDLRQQPTPEPRLPLTCLDLGGGIISCL